MVARSCWRTVALVVCAAVWFHAAYVVPYCSALIFLFLLNLVALTQIATARGAFVAGVAVGVLIYAPQLSFFYGLFGPFAILLWGLLALYPAVFLVLGRAARVRLPRALAMLAIPVLWTGLEYFRSELYYLRFAWLTPGLAFSGSPMLLKAGVYGVTFALLSLIALLHLMPKKVGIGLGIVSFAGLVLAANVPDVTAERWSSGNSPRVVGIQLELASESELLRALDGALAKYPDGDVFVLSEDAVAEIPDSLFEWCRGNRRYLVVGSSEAAPEERGRAGADAFYNTAFVINPEGRIEFKQAKSVPVQFFVDGMPAKRQAVWESPWGKIGVCICYDLSYSRVTDRLIREGARALIVPTMDMETWGAHEHSLHARIAPARAAEYGVPVFRVTSSGISQCVSRTGEVMERTSYPGQGEVVSGRLDMGSEGRVPVDRVLGPVCSGVVPFIFLLLLPVKRRRGT